MSGDGSAEVSVPTDLTVTSDGDSEDGYAASRRHARELQAIASDRAELRRTVEKQKLELQSKDSQLAALKTRHETSIAKSLAEKDSIISAKQIQINRVEAELTHTKEELNTIRERAARELAQLTQKCAVFQQNQKRLTIRQDELRSSLSNLQLSEEEYVRLRSTPTQQLNLQQYTALRVYELVWPLRLQVRELGAVKSSLESSLAARESDLKSRNEQYLRLQETVHDLRSKSENYASHLLTLRDEQRDDDFKVRNYNRVKSERDQLEEEKSSLTKKIVEQELLIATLRKEKDILEERYNEVKQKARKQEHDLSLYREDAISLRNKLERVSDELDSSSKNLRIERERNGELHEKYVNARGEITSLTENIQESQHETKMLKEKLQSCNLLCSNLQEKVDYLSEKNEVCHSEMDKYKRKYESETKALDTELRELRFIITSITKNRDNLLIESSKLQQDLQSAELHLQQEKHDREKETVSLKQQLERVENTLTEYQALEAEFEKNIKAAAALPEQEAFISLGKSLPGLSLSKNRAVEHSVQLTRRVLLLERQNTEALTTIQQLTDALGHLKNTVTSYKSALTLAGEPSAALLERIASQEDQIATLQAALNQNSVSKGILEREKSKLSLEVTKLKNEFHNVSLQMDELNGVREQLLNLLQSLPSSQVQASPGTTDSGNNEELGRQQHATTSQNRERQHAPTKAIVITKEDSKDN